VHRLVDFSPPNYMQKKFGFPKVVFRFSGAKKSYEKQLLASSCPYVCPLAVNKLVRMDGF